MFVDPEFYQIIFGELTQKNSEARSELPTMHLFASQLNAEMVYCILKGITQFSKVTFDGLRVENQDFYRMTTNEIMPTYTEDMVDAVINFDKIKIKIKNWADIPQD